MTRAELLEMLEAGENSYVEFKKDTISPRHLAEEIVAFANSEGGRILLGVDDNGQRVGITRPDGDGQGRVSRKSSVPAISMMPTRRCTNRAPDHAGPSHGNPNQDSHGRASHGAGPATRWR